MAKKQILPEKKKKKKETTPQLDSAAARLVKTFWNHNIDKLNAANGNKSNKASTEC